ncbi:MAG: hypothetical protein LBO66_06280 [Deltaproteobacteria bacterium]|jgi:hypothetical protein|nr:hypothetical protein [Deltaproteobacteria bacterium]
MNNNSSDDYRNPSLLRKKGVEALTKALGPVGTAYFIRLLNVAKAITLMSVTLFWTN